MKSDFYVVTEKADQKTGRRSAWLTDGSNDCVAGRTVVSSEETPGTPIHTRTNLSVRMTTLQRVLVHTATCPVTCTPKQPIMIQPLSAFSKRHELVRRNRAHLVVYCRRTELVNIVVWTQQNLSPPVSPCLCRLLDTDRQKKKCHCLETGSAWQTV